MPDMGAHTFNPSAHQAQAGTFTWAPGQPGQYKKAVWRKEEEEEREGGDALEMI